MRTFSRRRLSQRSKGCGPRARTVRNLTRLQRPPHAPGDSASRSRRRSSPPRLRPPKGRGAFSRGELQPRLHPAPSLKRSDSSSPKRHRLLSGPERFPLAAGGGGRNGRRRFHFLHTPSLEREGAELSPSLAAAALSSRSDEGRRSAFPASSAGAVRYGLAGSSPVPLLCLAFLCRREPPPPPPSCRSSSPAWTTSSSNWRSRWSNSWARSRCPSRAWTVREPLTSRCDVTRAGPRVRILPRPTSQGRFLK